MFSIMYVPQHSLYILRSNELDNLGMALVGFANDCFNARKIKT